MLFEFGTDTDYATFENNSIVKFNGTAGCDFNMIGGVSSLYPVQFTGTDIDWGYDGSFDGTPAIGLKNIDYQTTATIGGTSNTVVRLYGDCEFDALTVDAGFTLDIDGHALTCSGQMTGASGTSVFADTAGNGIISCQALNQSNTSSMSNSHLILTGTGTTDVQSPFKNVLYNIGSSTLSGYRGWGTNTSNVIIGSGTYEQTTRDYAQNALTQHFTIARGATFAPVAGARRAFVLPH